MDIRSTLEALCDAFNAHDLDRIMGFFVEDCVLEMPRGGEPWGARYRGKAEVREAGTNVSPVSRTEPAGTVVVADVPRWSSITPGSTP